MKVDLASNIEHREVSLASLKYFHLDDTFSVDN